MTYKNAYSIADKLKCEAYEGVFHKKEYFTPEIWSNCRQVSKWVLIKPETDDTRSLACTKQLYYPLQQMQRRVDLLLNLTHDIIDDLKYVLNSAHDD